MNRELQIWFLNDQCVFEIIIMIFTCCKIEPERLRKKGQVSFQTTTHFYKWLLKKAAKEGRGKKESE